MSPSEERELRRRLVRLIGQLDAKDGLDRRQIERTIEDLTSACRAAGWNIPQPLSKQ